MELTLNMKSMKFILMTKRLNRDLSHTIETGWIIRLNSFSNQAAVLSWLCDIEFIKTKPRRIFGKRVKEKKRNRPSVKSEVATLAPVSLGPAPGRRLCASIDRRPRLIVVDLSLSLSLSPFLSQRSVLFVDRAPIDAGWVFTEFFCFFFIVDWMHFTYRFHLISLTGTDEFATDLIRIYRVLVVVGELTSIWVVILLWLPSWKYDLEILLNYSQISTDSVRFDKVLPSFALVCQILTSLQLFPSLGSSSYKVFTEFYWISIVSSDGTIFQEQLEYSPFFLNSTPRPFLSFFPFLFGFFLGPSVFLPPFFFCYSAFSSSVSPRHGVAGLFSLSLCLSLSLSLSSSPVR